MRVLDIRINHITNASAHFEYSLMLIWSVTRQCHVLDDNLKDSHNRIKLVVQKYGKVSSQSDKLFLDPSFLDILRSHVLCNKPEPGCMPVQGYFFNGANFYKKKHIY